MMYKRGLFTIIIFLILICCSLYFEEHFNQNAISFELTNKIEADFNQGLVGIGLPVYEMRYQMPYGEGSLIMTSGHSHYFNRDQILEGVYIHPDIKNGIVLGDHVAGATYRHLDVIGNEYSFLGQDYEIIGILENSDDIMIPYDKKHLSKNWTKFFASYHINSIDDIPSKVSFLRNQLVLNDGNIRSLVVYYEYGLAFKNMSFFVLLVFLMQSIFYWMKKFVIAWKKLYKILLEKKVRKLYRTIFLEEIKLIYSVLYKLTVSLILIGLSIFIMSNIEIPKRLIASNVMSLESWMNLMTLYLDQVMISFKYGFFTVRRDFLLILVLMVFVYTRIYHSYKYKQVRHEE